MTTPTTFSAAERIITYAYRDAGIIGRTANPTSDQLADGLNRLNDLINLWQTQGIKLWLLADTSVTLVVGQKKYALAPSGDVVMTKPLKVIQAYYLSAELVRRPLSVLAWEEWLRLSQTSTQGAVNSYFVDKQATHLDVSLWPTPDSQAATGTVQLLLQHQVQNFVGLRADMNFPMEWAIALRWGLADDLATGQPQEIVERCERRATAFRQALDDWDVEDASVKFVPDARMGQPNHFNNG
jgi:hypothetical protein